MNLIRRILNLISKKNTLKSTNDGINIDLGASSIKYCINGSTNNFISSVREIHNDAEIVDQKNIINVNNTWYAVGESKVPVSSIVRKCKKPNIDIMILYALIKEQLPSGNYNINMLLPYTQLSDKTELANRINSEYKIRTATGEKYSYVLNVQNVKCEGQMSYYYMKNESDTCTVIMNIGFSTSDVAIFKNDEQEEPVTIQTGTNIIMNQYKHKLDAPNTSVLSYRLANGDAFTKEEEKENRKSIDPCIDGLINDLKTVLRFVPQKSRVVICGGGAIQFGEMIKEKIEFKNTIVLKNEQALYTDVLGLSLFCANNNGIKNMTENNSTKGMTESDSIKSIAEKDIAENNDRKNITENRKEELTENNSIKVEIEEKAESNDIKVLKFPEREKSNIYDIVLKRLGQVGTEKRISPKNLELDLSDYEWRKIKNKLLENGLIVVKGTNTYKKENADHEVRA